MKVTFKANVIFKGKRQLCGGVLEVSEEEAKHLAENGMIEAPPSESLKKLEALADAALKVEAPSPAQVPAAPAPAAEAPAFDIDAMIADASKQEAPKPEAGETPPKAEAKKSGKKGKA